MELFASRRQQKVYEKVESSIRTYEFLGDVAELFFPKLADTVTVMLGGDVIDHDSEYLTIEEGGWADDTPPIGPANQEDIIR